MPNYAFIDKDNIVKELLWFDEPQEDLSEFIEIQKQILNEDELIAIEVKDTDQFYSKGNTWDGNEFKPPQPYPSWIWDQNKFMWRSPVMYPNIIPGLRSTDDEYEWNEENQSWDLK